jgi:hypothetical protein
MNRSEGRVLKEEEFLFNLVNIKIRLFDDKLKNE